MTTRGSPVWTFRLPDEFSQYLRTKTDKSLWIRNVVMAAARHEVGTGYNFISGAIDIPDEVRQPFINLLKEDHK